MFDFKISNKKQICRVARTLGYPLLKKYKDNGRTGYLIYRGFFGGKHNFAYAQLSTIDKKSQLYKNLFNNHKSLMGVL